MILTLIVLAMLHMRVPALPQDASPERKCGQPSVEQDRLLREAIDNRYTLRRIELIGNKTLHDSALRRRVFLQEGDFFNPRNLIKSLVSLNKLKTLYPLTMNDVIIRREKFEKLVDVTFCFRERHSRSKSAS